MGTRDTAMLLVRALEGDADSRGQLFERVRPRVVLWAAARIPSELRELVEPDELAEDVLRRAYRQFHELRGADFESFLGWLFAVAESRVARLAEDPANCAADGYGGHVAAVSREEVACMRRAIQGLAQEHRDILRLCRFERRTPEAAAGRLGRTPSDVRVMYYRALKALDLAMNGGRA